MSNGTLPFSHTDYDKLHHAVFPTLRRRDKYGDVGDVNEVMVGPKGNRESWGNAQIIAKETVTLLDLNNELFKYDTQAETMAEGKETINAFYRNNIGAEEEITLYWNKWVDND